MLLEKQISEEQYVVKIHSVALPASGGISEEDSTKGWHVLSSVTLHVGRIGHILLSCDELVFCVADGAEHISGLIRLVVEPHLLDDGFDKALAVCCIVDGEL